MKHAFLLLSIITCICINNIHAQTTYPFVQRDTTLSLDIYYPARPNGYTIIHIFGGGFISGSRTNKWDADYCRQLTDSGYTAIAIDYRLGLRGVKKVGLGNVSALENAFYLAAQDCSAAIAYLVKNADQLHIDAGKIIIEGSSAGAIAALMTEYGRCNRLTCTAELPDGWKPAAIVAYSGAIYSKQGKIRWDYDTPAPILLFHGTADKIVTYDKIKFGKLGLYGANAIVKQIDKRNLPYTVYRYTDLGHEVSIAGPITMDELNLFVKQYVIEKKQRHTDITQRDDAYPPSEYSNKTTKDLYNNNREDL